VARRKRVEGPTAEDLRELEEGFATKPMGNPFAVPPIAQVAADAAAAAEPLPAEARVEIARDRSDAETLRSARASGRLIEEISVADIATDELSRDRMALSRDELDELKISIRSHGLRLPVEVFEIAEPGQGARYGLISGLRRVTAVRELYGPGARVAALVRQPRDAAEATVAMVEENEIRAGLSHYERGRIAVLATRQGRFADLDEAVARLFGSASKAKRSKIRSFALVHEELGDMLGFPQELTEKDGLRLANALRLGFESRLREVLSTGQGVDAASEWRALLPAIEEAESGGRAASRGGRPRKTSIEPGERSIDGIRLPGGTVVRREQDGRDHLIRFRGGALDAATVDRAMREVCRLLGAAN
jgi:ParB family chromosome partitioning protein